MAVGNLFKYKTTYELTLSDSGKRMTGPMYNNTIKIHKGMNDNITFNVSDDSRRAANVANLTLTFRMIDANTGVTVLSKTPVARDDVNGKIDVEFLWAETVNLDIGLYQFSVTATDVNDSESIFYTDLSQDAIGTIELLDSVAPSPSETLNVVATDFTVNGTRHESTPLTASPDRSYTSSLHTVVVYLTDYTGLFYVEGSHDITAPVNWYIIDLHPANALLDHNIYTSKTGLDPNNFILATNWVRFVHIPDGSNVGTIDKVMIRS